MADNHNGGQPIADDVPNMHFVKFYPGDFLNGTAHMSLEMVGAYIRTLCVMYDRMGGFPADEHMGSTLLRVDKRVYRRVRDQLIADGKVFVAGDTIRNVRVEREISDYVAEYKRRSEAAKKREADRRERQTYAELSPDLSPTSAELAPEVRDKSDELEAKKATKTTKEKPRDEDILEARSQKLEARIEESNPQTPTGGSPSIAIFDGAAEPPRAVAGKAVAREAFRQWQDFASKHGLSIPRDTTFETFSSAILARMREHADEQTQRGLLAIWHTALAHVAKSKWLRGMSGDFKADLGMILRPKNFAKLISGGYGNGAYAADDRWKLAPPDRTKPAEKSIDKIQADIAAQAAADGWEFRGGDM